MVSVTTLLRTYWVTPSLDARSVRYAMPVRSVRYAVSACHPTSFAKSLEDVTATLKRLINE